MSPADYSITPVPREKPADKFSHGLAPLGWTSKPADFAAVESPSLNLAPAPRPASLNASPLIDETIRQLRTQSGWWSGDANARKVLAAMLRRAAK